MAAALLVAAGIAGCGLDGRRNDERIAAWTRDSVSYEAALAEWRRDSTVIDSIASAADVDSLRRLYAALPHTADRKGVDQATMCEEAKLGYRYGLRPSQLAIKRTYAEARRRWPADFDPEAAYYGKGPQLLMLSDDCVLRGPIPQEAGGVSLQYDLPRPRAPKRPWGL